MFEINSFFENEVRNCTLLAESASDKSDREFWLHAAHRWEELLTARLNVENRPPHPQRRRRYRAYFRTVISPF
jgi:hypothetical protein